jgi:rod shape determining protein RodA
LKLRSLDWSLLVAVLALTVLGTLLVWSATARRPDVLAAASTGYLARHVVSIVAGAALAVPLVFVRHRQLRVFAPVGYVAVVAGLIAVLLLGVRINGSQAWIALPGGFSLQPGEFAKVALVIGMAVVLTERRDADPLRARPGLADVGWMLAVAVVPIGLVALQPDIGTVLVLGTMTFAVLALAGVRLWWLGSLLLAGGVAVAGMLWFGLVADYQLDRLTAFARPELDPQGAGYNVAQARLAVAGGGLLGQGLFHGVRTGGGFVPEQHTDFVFTVAGEEWGFAGAAAVLLLIGFVLWRGMQIAGRAPDLFGRLVAAGVVCWFAVQTFENVGMSLGLAPVTGVPLPFISYGGSSMMACLLAIGLLQNIQLRSSAGE